MCCESWIRSDAWELVSLFQPLDPLEKTGMVESMKSGDRAIRVNRGDGASTRVI